MTQYHKMHRQSLPRDYIKKIITSKIFLFFVVFVFISLVISLSRESYRKYQLNQEIGELEVEIERLESDNNELANLLNYLQQDSYLEKEARIKLNLKKPGEKVVILPSFESELDDEEQNSNDSQLDSKSDEANYWKWWERLLSLTSD